MGEKPSEAEIAADVSEIRTGILAGDYDGHLVTLSQALQARAMSGETVVKWQLKLDELELTEDDLTFPEAVKWSKVAGENWSTLRPLSDASVCQALLLVLLDSRLGLTGDAAVEKLNGWTQREVVEAFTEYEVASPAPLPDGSDSSG